MKIEDNPAFAEKLPRICYVLGGDKTPLKLGEEFEFKCRGGKFRINDSGIVERTCGSEWDAAAAIDIILLVDNPNEIIRRPQFSEDENAFLRLLVKNGLPWLARDDDGDFAGFQNKPHNDNGDYDAPGNYNELPKKLLTQITFESGPFDAAAYLESEAAK